MKINAKQFFLTSVLLMSGAILGGCASVAINPNANKVIAAPNKPPLTCHYLGQVTGSQGNMITGEFTSNKSLDAGALNDLKNKAANEGGNYVQLITMKTSNYGSLDKFGGRMEQTGATTIGNVYHCPPRSIDE